MQNNVTIKKLCENEYRVSGTILYLKDCSKYINVDGVEYTNTKYEEDEINLDKEWEKNDRNHWWRKLQTDFLHYFQNPEITMWTYSNAHTFIDNVYWSTNEWVAFIQILSHKKILPITVYTGKFDGERYGMNQLRKNEEIEFVIYDYGFNNSITTFVKYTDFLKLNLPINRFRLKFDMQDFFPINLVSYTDEQKSELLIKYVNRLYE